MGGRSNEWQQVDEALNIKGDERILGDSDFVETVLKQSQETYERRYRLKTKGVDLETIAQRVAKLLDMPVHKAWSRGKYRRIVSTQSLLCYWAVRELGVTASVLATAISESVLRGEVIAQNNGYPQSCTKNRWILDY
jgi:REP-associated tyrosine transposase